MLVNTLFAGRKVITLSEAMAITRLTRSQVLRLLEEAGWGDHGRTVFKYRGVTQQARHFLSSPGADTSSAVRLYEQWRDESSRTPAPSDGYAAKLAALPPIASMGEIREALRVSASAARAIAVASGWKDLGMVTARVDREVQTSKRLFIRPREVQGESNSDFYKLWLRHRAR